MGFGTRWEKKGETDERYEGQECGIHYCEENAWVKLVVRGEVGFAWAKALLHDVDCGVTRIVSIYPDDMVGDVYTRERVVCFCKYHATTLMGETVFYEDVKREGPSGEGMTTCTDCGAENTPCVDYVGGSEGDGGRACVVCCDERGVA